MKILCLSDCLGFRGGAERQLSGLVYFLHKRGYNVHAVTYLKQDYPSVLESDYGLSYKCLNASGMIQKLIKVGHYIRRNSIDTVIAYKDGPAKICCILKMLGFKFNLIVSERSTTQVLSKSERQKFFLYRFANSIVPNSYSQDFFIHKHFPILGNKASTIINYVDIDRFYPKHFSPLKDVSCIVVSSIKEAKNPLVFIKALNILKQKGVNLYVDWFGNINDKVLYEKCKKLIAEQDLSDYIQIRPATSSIQDEYPKYELFCLPSLYEGFPNTLCEAMSCGLPVIASNVCDNPYILDGGKYGLLCDPKDASSIADAFEEYTKNRRCRRDADGIANRERIVSLCSEEAFVNKYIDLIRR